MIEFFTEEQAAKQLGVKVSTLATWRKRGVGPRYMRLGQKFIRYTSKTLADWASEAVENERAIVRKKVGP